MELIKPILKQDEAFFPTEKGRIIQLHELEINDQTLTNINQYKAIREAKEQGGYLLSVKEDLEAFKYAKSHQEDQKLKAYYNSITSGMQYARWTRTQVHNLSSDCLLIVNIAEVHPQHDFVLRYENIVEAPWLPKTSGYIQELDEKTGFPRKVGSRPNSNFNKAYFLVNPDFDVVAVIHNWNSGLILDLNREPSFVDSELGVRLAKNFSTGNLERKLIKNN